MFISIIFWVLLLLPVLWCRMFALPPELRYWNMIKLSEFLLCIEWIGLAINKIHAFIPTVLCICLLSRSLALYNLQKLSVSPPSSFNLMGTKNSKRKKQSNPQKKSYCVWLRVTPISTCFIVLLYIYLFSHVLFVTLKAFSSHSCNDAFDLHRQYILWLQLCIWKRHQIHTIEQKKEERRRFLFYIFFCSLFYFITNYFICHLIYFFS